MTAQQKVNAPPDSQRHSLLGRMEQDSQAKDVSIFEDIKKIVNEQKSLAEE
jgi:hypothetical protein